MKRNRRGSDIGSELRRLAGRLDRKGSGGLQQARVSTAWQAIAGPTVLSHTTGEHVRAGELIVYVDSPVWATELSALAENYRQGLNEQMGEEAVRSVRFAVSRKVAERRREVTEEEETSSFYTEDVVPSVPLTQQERAQVEASVAEIRDLELRAAVLRATVADLEWKKGLSAAKRRQERREGV